MTRGARFAVIGIAIATIAIVTIVTTATIADVTIGNRKTVAQPAPVVQTRPVSDVECGGTYQFTHMERFYINGRVAVNFYFGGRDRNLQPQYIWDENVLGQSTEVRKARTVLPSLEYSMVTFLCQSDPSLEGHKVSNVELVRYQLTLRRPLRPQKGIRNGGPDRK